VFCNSRMQANSTRRQIRNPRGNPLHFL